MPKPLSLKKVSATAINQKSITSFFKNTNAAESQKVVLDSSQPISTKTQQTNLLKRKATSPVPEQQELSKLEIGNKITDTAVQKLPKKQKNEKIASQVTPQKINKQSKVALLKENCDQYSPKKIEQLFSDLREKSCQESTTDNHEDIEDDPNIRPPLSPIKNGYHDVENNKSSQMVNQVTSTNGFTNHDEITIGSSNKVVKNKTPRKMETNMSSSHSPLNFSLTPEKSPPSVPTELRRSPRIAKLKTPVKAPSTSPVKDSSSAKVALDFDNVDDMFGDAEEWEGADLLDEECLEDLDLSVMQRCEVTSVNHEGFSTVVRLKNSENKQATCVIDGLWYDTPLSPGEIVSMIASRDATGQYRVSNSSGLVVLRPDHLMSTTGVVAAVFCRRKALLQERFKGIDCANNAMTIGILIHELVQKALIHRITDIQSLRTEADTLIHHSTHMLYDAGLSVEETRSNMDAYLVPLSQFMLTYVADKAPASANNQKHRWNGHIDEILDIEENICCPQLGLKGKIDATLQVTIHDRKGHKRAIVPLELKSGRASGSAEHRGQIVLYNMMLNVQRDVHPITDDQRGLLLYLKERVDLREVSCGHPEKRDLIMLRNQLVQYLSIGPHSTDTEKLTDIEEASQLLSQNLPEPIHHENACSKCPYLTLCSIHLWNMPGPTVSETHPLSKLRPVALGHLSSQHVQYFKHWSALLKMEERVQLMTSPLHALWTDDAEKRSKRGACAANLKLKSVVASGDRFVHVFQRDADQDVGADSKNAKGPQEGEFSIVSIKKRPWIAAGVISALKGAEIHIMLERDLSRRLSKDTMFYIDTYESFATTVQNLTNLGVLMEDSDRADRLRRLIVDKTPPEFDKKLPREVGRLGTKLMKSLNIQQQRAVLKALSAQDYALLQGLPGTGKTQTISVLIQMLVALKQRVLVTAHTHSAVDTVLNRLPPSVRVMRLGSSARVAPSLQPRCEHKLAEHCDTPDKLEELYNSMEVVGVTCLGANHAMLARTTFDICIVDEATQVPQCTVLRPLLAARRFVLVGDPEQLPPVVRSRAARRLGMEESLFHRLVATGATSTLQLQYRMNATLARLANVVAYGGRLECANERVRDATLHVDVKKLSRLYSESPWLEAACSPELQQASLFLDMGVKEKTNTSRSCANADEACVVLALVEALKEGGVSPSDIGVIAPYREQVSLLRRAVARLGGAPVEVSTVDQFQGRDKSVILYSCTRTDGGDDLVKEGEVLNDQRRLAVSVTRAKHKLLVIGHRRALRKYAPLQKMIEACSTVSLTSEVKLNVVKKYGHYVV